MDKIIHRIKMAKMVGLNQTAPEMLLKIKYLT